MNKVVGDTLGVFHLEIGKIVFNIGRLVERTEVGLEFVHKSVPVVEPIWISVGEARKSRFEPFLSHILEIGHSKNDSFGIVLKFRQPSEIQPTLHKKSL